jgi:hypothetical protein
MNVYPVPVEVTQARVQLLVDQTAKAPPNTINEDLARVYETKSQALLDQNARLAARHMERHAEQRHEQRSEQPVEQHAAQPAPTEHTALLDVKV